MILPTLVTAMLVSAALAQPSVSDGEVAALLKAANDAEISASEAAIEKTQSQDVAAYAQQMIADHGKSNEEVAPFVPAGGTSTGQAQRFADQAAQQRASMAGLSGAAFDSVYVAAQVQDHRQVLGILDRALGSSGGRAPNLQELLQRTRASIASHLTRAQQLQSQLKAR